METNYSGSGMGTAGLVGQFATIEAMGTSLNVLLIIGLMHFLLPLVLVLGVDLIFRKKGWIQLGDLALSDIKK
jgi:hypothetical protein